MKPLHLLGAAFWALASSALGCQCSSGGAVSDAGRVSACVSEKDCPDSRFFSCNAPLCEPICRSSSDCDPGVRGSYALASCSQTGACACIDSACVPAKCSSSSDCTAPQVCRAGGCQSEPPVGIARCEVVPSWLTLAPATEVRLSVLAYDAAGAAVVALGQSWSALSASVSVTASGSPGQAPWATAAAVPGTTPVTSPVPLAKVTLGASGVSCSAIGVVLGARTAGSLRVVVEDARSARGIATARVQAGALSAMTDANGVAEIPVAGPVEVTVFHPDYDVVTLGAYDATGGSKELLILLHRNPLDRIGGFVGLFPDVPVTENLHVALSALAGSEELTDLVGDALLGAPVATDAGSLGAGALFLPEGMYLGLGAQSFKPFVVGRAPAGTCAVASDGFSDVEEEIREGRCATAAVWALAGDIPVDELSPTTLLNPTLRTFVPFLKGFKSSLKRDVTLLTRPPALPEDLSYFTPVAETFSGVPLGLQRTVSIPDLPRYPAADPSAFLKSVTLLAGVSVPGRGFVTLGFGAGENATPRDAKTDLEDGQPAAGLLKLTLAPAHDGLEGAPYGVLVTATTDAAVSAIFHRFAENSVLRGAPAAETLDPFPPIPEGGQFDAEARQVRVPGASLTSAGVTVVRVTWTGASRRRWVVWTAPSDAENGVTLPAPPPGFEDRTSSTFQVEALVLREGAAGISLSHLFENDGVNVDRLTDWTAAFSRLDYGSP